MKPSILTHSILRRLYRFVALVIGSACALPALAELGGSPTLSLSDAPAATNSAAAPTAKWQMREVTRPNGGVEREYVGADGKVFAVAWRSPFRPALSVLMGVDYATQMARDAHALRQSGMGSLHTTSQSGPAFAVSASAHQRLWTGIAWLPPLLPDGVDPHSLAIMKGA